MAFETPPRVLVVGLGSSGLAAARLATKDGSEVWATDLRSELELAVELTALGGDIHTFLGDHPESCLDGVELVITSPGVPAKAPLLAAARERGIQINTEIEDLLDLFIEGFIGKPVTGDTPLEHPAG